MYDWVVPEPQRRWERSGMTGEVTVKQDADGHDVNVPLFDVGVNSFESLPSREFGSKDKPVGKVYAELFHLKDGMTRLVQIWVPYDVQAEFTATSGMAFLTMAPGYDAERSELLALRGIPVIQVSNEQGDKYLPHYSDIAKLGKTALLTPQMSIAKSAQAATEIVANVISRYELPQQIEIQGDSNGGISSIGRAVYASLALSDSDNTPMYNLNPIWIDPKALVLHDRLPASKAHKIGKWVAKEATAGPQVIAELAIERALLSLRGTVSLNPNFLLATIAGTGPSIVGGETGELVKMLPDDMRGFANAYIRDELYDRENWQNGLRPFHNLYLNEVDKAVHAHLLSRRGLRRQIERIDRLAEESREHGANITAYNVHYISGRTPEQFALQKDINLQSAA